MSGRLILISAPSGAGKTSLVAAALKADPILIASVSHTTRPQRSQEQDGVNYHFTNTANFEAMVAADEFLEHAVVFGNQYGTAKPAVDAQLAAGRDVILEIDWQGAAQVRTIAPDALSIFILPPSMSVLRERLEGRAQDSATIIEGRLAEAKLEMSKAPHYEYIVVNDDFDQSLADILGIIAAQRLSARAQMSNNSAVQSILSGS